MLRIFSLLLVLPLLLPTGVCICHAHEADAQTSDQEAEHSVPAPADHPEEHSPGCPPLRSAFLLKINPDTDLAHALVAPALGGILPVVCEAGFSEVPASPAPFWHLPGSPLYLTLLTLRN